jgi:sRNA-binding protein
VLRVWKSRAAYCTAVLAHPKRINLDNLDGSASDEEVDEKARALAKEQLAVLASRPPRAQKKAATPAAGLSVASTAARRDSHKSRIWNIAAAAKHDRSTTPYGFALSQPVDGAGLRRQQAASSAIDQRRTRGYGEKPRSSNRDRGRGPRAA